MHLRTSAVLLAAIATAALAPAQTPDATTADPASLMNFEHDVTPPPPGEYLKHLPADPKLIKSLPGHAVRIAYIIPSNRTAQADAVAKLQYAVSHWRAFYADQMERNGFGPKTFSIETEPDGVTPTVHIVNAPNTDAYYNVDPWTRVSTAAQNAGLPVWASGNVWLEVFEGHTMNADGSITGVWNGGANNGSGSDGGVGMFCAYMLTLVTASDLVDNRSYDNLTFPVIGPYPMKYGVTQATFDGSTISSLSSVQHGVLWHETDHGLGMSHDFRNDVNFAGNLMGNGFRGTRGYEQASAYPNDEVRGSYAACLALNVSRYFNPTATWTDNTKPTASLLTSGAVDVGSTGHLPIHFTASDAGGLSAALLLRDGEVIGEMPLSGTSTDQTFNTPYYTLNTTATLAVHVYDAQGNKQVVSASITPTINVFVPNKRAPQPFFRAKPSRVTVGQSMLLDASLTSDPDNSASTLTVEWDLNNDGTYDTAPTTTKTYNATFNTTGTRLIRCRVTDPSGAVSVSTPIGVRVVDAVVTAVPAGEWGMYE